MRLLLATTNKGKITEMREALNGLGLELLDVNDVKTVGAPEETGKTFAENAAQKAHHYFAETGLPTVADDSGIHVDALEGELGIHTRRWGAGPRATDEEWIAHFLERMKKEKNKRAQFVCTIAHVDSEGRLHMFEGTCEGVITDALEADYLPGLPISACFKPDGEEYVFSAMKTEQKNRSSHRGRALKQFREFLQTRQAA
ncbi:MAG: non-canonical purine NTP pyrophosphatase [Candidatus Peribacteraceae bacterium]|nr:non-canonical purine NTP pyrophosphatase [Candidatus Peribacteraceae bacterium]